MSYLYTHELAAFNSYIDRLHTIPISETNFQIELNYIKKIKKVAVNNGYSSEIINRLVYKKTM